MAGPEEVAKYREIGGPRQNYKRVKRVLHYKKRLDDSDFKKSTAQPIPNSTALMRSAITRKQLMCVLQL